MENCMDIKKCSKCNKPVYVFNVCEEHWEEYRQSVLKKVREQNKIFQAKKKLALKWWDSISLEEKEMRIVQFSYLSFKIVNKSYVQKMKIYDCVCKMFASEI